MPERIGVSSLIALSERDILPVGVWEETVKNDPPGLSVIAGDIVGFTTFELRGDMIASLALL